MALTEFQNKLRDEKFNPHVYPNITEQSVNNNLILCVGNEGITLFDHVALELLSNDISNTYDEAYVNAAEFLMSREKAWGSEDGE